MEISLPVAKLNIHQAVPFFRQRQQRFRKEENLLDPNGQLIGLGSKQVPAHANRVAQIQQVKQLKSLLSDNIFLYIDLSALSASLQVRKTRFPHQPESHDAAGDTHFLIPSRLQFRGGRLPPFPPPPSRPLHPPKIPRV